MLHADDGDSSCVVLKPSKLRSCRIHHSNAIISTAEWTSSDKSQAKVRSTTNCAVCMTDSSVAARLLHYIILFTFTITTATAPDQWRANDSSEVNSNNNNSTTLTNCWRCDPCKQTLPERTKLHMWSTLPMIYKTMSCTV